MAMNRKIKTILVFLAAFVSLSVSAQTGKPRLAILPITGISGEDGKTIAVLFSMEDEIKKTFEIIPRTEITEAIDAEQNFQREGKTNVDTIKALGNSLSADYVLSGSITAMAGHKLLLISIIHIEYLQQIAGSYYEYQEIEDVINALPLMAKEIVGATKINTSSQRKLSVVPIASVSGKVNQEDAEVLTQILATEIVKSGKFAVFPRTSSLEQVMKEHDNQRDGTTDQNGIKEQGIGINPDYVLSVQVMNIGKINMFTAAILNMVERSQGEESDKVEYETIEDGVRVMQELGQKFTGVRKGSSDSMVKIEGGAFTMGSPESETGRNSNETQHQVQVNGFWMGKYEVAQKEYEEIMGINPSGFKDLNLPVEQVSWYDAIEYCNKRSIYEGLTPAYTIDKTRFDPGNTNSDDSIAWLVSWNKQANGYRLPTEAEWEYACRAGTASPFNTGNTISVEQANYNGNDPYNKSAAVQVLYREKTIGPAALPPNNWDLYNMHGNVWEWCWDWYGEYTAEKQDNPAGPEFGGSRIIRGGGWYGYDVNLRSASRAGFIASKRASYLGFRVVRSNIY
jgi:formylglycine-generating enzyme required for sulfatase activity/TolB-like protein